MFILCENFPKLLRVTGAPISTLSKRAKEIDKWIKSSDFDTQSFWTEQQPTDQPQEEDFNQDEEGITMTL
jgi:hypothetical protein